MDAVINTNTPVAAARNEVRATELLSLLDKFPKIKTLSLDCFDTLIWRKTITPIDVFFNLQEKPTFKSYGFSARLRIKAEQQARDKMMFRTGCQEVTLSDIYLASFPHLTSEQVAALAEEEILEEMSACYAFPPMVELIKAAHARGMKVIIVSDTYLQEKQLKRLLENTLPAGVMPLISKIFVSCEHGWSKSQGLLKKVCKQLGQQPKTMLHIGDNNKSDYEAPLAAGMNAAYLLHQHEPVAQLLRMQALAGGFIDPGIRQHRALNCTFRGVLAAATVEPDKAESLIGYASIGQIMYAFSRYICEENESLRKQGKKTKVLFLMRDAYLLSLVCETLEGKEVGKRVRISRFAAFAATFRRKEDIDKYLCENAGSLRFAEMCKQFLLPASISAEITAKAEAAKQPASEFVRQIEQNKIMQLIFSNSKAYRKRLFQHLKNEVNLEPGDTLIFADLGYTGTAQLQLEPLLKEEMDIEIQGRYLIALRTPGWEATRRGLIDASWCDDRTMQLLVAYIALLEQICTENEKSVIDYDNNGNPLFSETSLSKQQYNKMENIQAECLRFVRDAQLFFQASGTTIPMQILRDTAMSELGRLLFLPSQTEIDYLQSFQFDVNMGTKDVLRVFDQQKGLEGLRRRGLFFMEKNLKSMRTNYPAELRVAGIELVLALMSQHRIEFDVRVHEMSLLRKRINVIFIRNGQAAQTMIDALPTYDGYYSLHIPIGVGNYQIGIQFGLAFKWVQLESAELIKTAALYGYKESDFTTDASSSLAVEKMNDKGGGLFECESKVGLLVYMPGQKLGEGNHVLRVVFRPIVERNTDS